jgi:hypothetical protein
MQKFSVRFDLPSERHYRPITAPDRETAEKLTLELFPEATNLYVQTFESYLYERCIDSYQKIDLNFIKAPGREQQVAERLRCSIEAAYLFGEASLKSLEQILDRIVACEWQITGLDSCPFSFLFTSPKGGFWGGIIFHSNTKEWVSHT